MVSPLPFALTDQASSEPASGELCRQFGSPLFVFSETTLRSTIRRFQRAFEACYSPVTFAWSYKTNYLRAICAILHQEGAWAEVVSRMEFEKSQRLNVPLERIVFNGPNQPLPIVSRVLAGGGIVTVDHDAAIADCQQIARETRQPVAIGLRIHLDAGLASHWSRFGFHLESGQAMQAAEMIAQSGLRIAGIHCHIGTAVLDPAAYGRSLTQMIHFGNELSDRWGWRIEFLDIGGGFPSRGRPKLRASRSDSSVPPEIPVAEAYARAVGEALGSHLRIGHRPRLILELGRALVDDAGQLITTVLATKRMPDGRPAAVVDAGVNLVGMASQFHLDVVPERRSGRATNEQRATALYGPLCMNTDVLHEGVTLPPLERGDRLVISPVGAYNISQSWQFIEYRPNIVLLRTDGSVDLIRERETLDDVERRERLPEDLLPEAAGQK